MRNSARRVRISSRAARIALVALALFAGCARAPENVPFTDADLRGHPQLAEWMDLWPPPASPLTADSFRLVRESNGIGELLAPSSPYGFAVFPKWQYKWLQYSPDSAWAVDLWLWQVDSLGVFLGEVDSHVSLLDLAGGQFYHLLDCGTPCGFHTAIWISESSFLVAGWEECQDDPPGRIMPLLIRYDLKEKRTRTFTGPPIGQESIEPFRASLREQWYSWYPWMSFMRFE